MELRTTESALLKLSQELGISGSDMGDKVTFEVKYSLGEMSVLLPQVALSLLGKYAIGQPLRGIPGGRRLMSPCSPLVYADTRAVR